MCADLYRLQMLIKDSSTRTLTLNGARFSKNNPNGALYLGTGSEVTLDGQSEFVGNSAGTGNGGAINIGLAVTLKLLATGSSTVAGNSAQFGGGVYIDQGSSFEVAGPSTWSGNTAAGAGGAAYLKSLAQSSMAAGHMVGNSASNGGGVYVGFESSVVISGQSRWFNNVASGSGGAVFLAQSGAFGASTAPGLCMAYNNAMSGGALYMSSSGANAGFSGQDTQKMGANTPDDVFRVPGTSLTCGSSPSPPTPPTGLSLIINGPVCPCGAIVANSSPQVCSQLSCPSGQVWLVTTCACGVSCCCTGDPDWLPVGR